MTQSAASRRRREAEEYELRRLRIGLAYRIADGVFSVLRLGIRSATWVVPFLLAYLAVIAYHDRPAGLSDVVLAFAALDFGKWAGYVASAIFGVAYFREKRTKKKLITERAPYVRRLEETIDPGRSSSKLRECGAPEREDLDEP